MQIPRRDIITLSLALTLVGMLCAAQVMAQTKQGMIALTKEEILAGAKGEGKLKISPSFHRITIPHMVKAFKKKYPFMKDVSWQIVTGRVAGQKRLFNMVAGKIKVDAFNVSTRNLETYFKHNLLKRYDFRHMAQSGQLKIPLEMIDQSGLFVSVASAAGAIAYNPELVPSDKAPKGWDDCLDPYWKGRLAVDTRPNTLVRLSPLWGEEKVLAYAKKLRAQNPIWVRGHTSTLTRMAAGEIPMFCGTYLHSSQRLLKKAPEIPLKVIVPDPVGVVLTESEGVYAKSENPHGGLLWIEFLVTKEAQKLLDSVDPGKGSFLVEGTVTNRLVKSGNVALCADRRCRVQHNKLEERIAVEAWGFPKVGYRP